MQVNNLLKAVHALKKWHRQDLNLRSTQSDTLTTWPPRLTQEA